MWFLRILSPKNFANSTTLFKRNVATLPAATIKEIARDVEESGFAIVDLPDSTERSLYELSYQFGTIQKNNNTNGLGISQIVGDVQKTNTNAADSVVSNLKFNLHTDGAYLHGFVKEANEQYRKCVPPKMVLLQCVKPAVTGGRNHLIDGKALVKAVWKNDPWILKALFRQDAMSISHRDHMIMDIPVFSHIDVDRIGIRYSYDRSLFFAPWAKQAHETFNSKYLEDPKLITHHNLIEGQCLIIDNHRMLHGRESFTGFRHVRRTWIQDEDRSTVLFNASMKQEDHYSSTKHFTPAFSRFEKYAPQESQPKSAVIAKIQLGISWTPQL